ncbi:MAG: hypothetical protein DYG93_05220 [Leptolyngbya sp. PLA2]|nr:hypothetical protein [Leptolyngbya sp.]MCE7971048.1 hypothetical protein [Leptolyngbya sp. PL-A2]MCZ7631879.1 hypothetical protein [Phycisphaerales bacterium]MDL1905357.1 hypothetical protein [Synechococcales cyanobacterium CNB]GIK20314.1 MAG: hypothetical protein BroJett004_24780 [Planctomycetota bacterium]
MLSKTFGIAVASALGAFGAAAVGQTMTFYWSPNRITISPANPSGTSWLLATWNTNGPPEVGFAQDLLDVLATNFDGTTDSVVWTPNPTISAYTNGFGSPQPNGDVIDIDLFQLPPFYNPYFDATHPLVLGALTFSTVGFTPRTIMFKDQNHRNTAVYADDFGTLLYLVPIDPGVDFIVVPTPGTLATLGLALGVAARRRR